MASQRHRCLAARCGCTLVGASGLIALGSLVLGAATTAGAGADSAKRPEAALAVACLLVLSVPAAAAGTAC